MFEKYRIEGPVDLKAELEAMYEELADEDVRKIERNVADAERRAGVAGGHGRDGS
jgi:hypothetical protein